MTVIQPPPSNYGYYLNTIENLIYTRQGGKRSVSSNNNSLKLE